MFDSLLSLFGGGNKEHQSVHVNALVLESVQLLRKELDDHNIAIRTKLASELPIILGNTAQLREVVLNLVQNSIDAMATTTRPRVISVATALRGSDSIAISLEDAGPGIAPEQLASIFEPFVTTKAGGTGLGLAICKMIVEQHAAMPVSYTHLTLPTKA